MTSAVPPGPMGMISTARAELAADLATLSHDQWQIRTLCASWTVEECVAHLTSAASMTPARWMLSMLGAGFRPALHNRRRLREHLGATPAETLARFTAVVDSTRAPSGHTAAWLGEIVVHGQDIRRPLGLTRPPSAEAATAVAEFFVSRDFAVPSRTAARGLRLEATDGPFRAGAGPLVRGTTEALVMAMAGRSAYLTDLTGDGVATMAGRISR